MQARLPAQAPQKRGGGRLGCAPRITREASPQEAYSVLVRAGAAAEQEGGGGAAAAPRGSTALLLLQTQVGSAPEGPNARAVGRRADAHCSSARQRRRSADGPASLPQAILYERHRAALARHRYPLYPALAAILDGGALPGAAQAAPPPPVPPVLTGHASSLFPY